MCFIPHSILNPFMRRVRGVFRSDMPLPCHECSITASSFLRFPAILIEVISILFYARILSFQHLRHSRHISSEKPLIRRSNTRIVDHVPNTGLVGIDPRQQGSTGRAASCAIVHLGEPDPSIAGQRVNVGRFYFGAETTNVTESEIIRQDNYDIGSAWICAFVVHFAFHVALGVRTFFRKKFMSSMFTHRITTIAIAVKTMIF
mmetsp:Transcript_9405/g.19827  ORF Transcript_9405/g.19827 Transcript_9405/m.19827 type:complete len:203 (+) Transcript_9405:529-1137(+)